MQGQTGAYQKPVYKEIARSKGGDFIFRIFKIKKIDSPTTPDNKPVQPEPAPRLQLFCV